MPFPRLGFKAVNNSVFDQRLYDKLRNKAALGVLLDILDDDKFIVKPELLDIEVVIDVFQLFFKLLPWRFFIRYAVPEDIGKRLDHFSYVPSTSSTTACPPYGFEGIIQKNAGLSGSAARRFPPAFSLCPTYTRFL